MVPDSLPVAHQRCHAAKHEPPRSKVYQEDALLLVRLRRLSRCQLPHGVARPFSRVAALSDCGAARRLADGQLGSHGV